MSLGVLRARLGMRLLHVHCTIPYSTVTYEFTVILLLEFLEKFLYQNHLPIGLVKN